MVAGLVVAAGLAVAAGPGPTLAAGSSAPSASALNPEHAPGPPGRISPATSGPAYSNGAVAHTPGGVPVAAASAPQEETWATGFFGAGEPNIGITADSASSTGYDVFGDAFTKVARSMDGGHTRTDVTPTVNGVPAHPTSLDPYLRVDTRTNRLFKADLATTCEFFSYSDDRGASWTNYTTACNLSDHETIAAGPPVTSTTVGYPDVVYDCSQSGGYNGASTASICDKSLDGGVTFVQTGAPAFMDPSPYGFGPGSGDSGIPGHCLGDIGPDFVGSDGILYVSRGWCGQPWVAVSHNEGLTWSRTQVAGNGMNTTLPDPTGLNDSGCGGFGLVAPGSGQSDHEAAVVADGHGDVFFMWMALDRHPYLAVSRDGGTTFGAPMMVGAPGVGEAWGPALGIDGAGRIALAYMGSANSPGAPWGCGAAYASVTFTGYIALIEDPLVAKPVIFSAPATPPVHPLAQGNCGPDRCNNTIDDFIDVKIAPDGSAWASYVDSSSYPAGSSQPNGNGQLLVGELLPPSPSDGVPETSLSALAILTGLCAGGVLVTARRRRARRAAVSVAGYGAGEGPGGKP